MEQAGECSHYLVNNILFVLKMLKISEYYRIRELERSSVSEERLKMTLHQLGLSYVLLLEQKNSKSKRLMLISSCLYTLSTASGGLSV